MRAGFALIGGDMCTLLDDGALHPRYEQCQQDARDAKDPKAVKRGESKRLLVTGVFQGLKGHLLGGDEIAFPHVAWMSAASRDESGNPGLDHRVEPGSGLN